MKTIKRWLLPVLTCLIAAAAVLTPPYLSRLRDRELMSAVHTETVRADVLSPAETTLEDRIGLLYRWTRTTDNVVSISQNLSKSELERDFQPFIRDCFYWFGQGNPTMREALSWRLDNLTGSRLLLRDANGKRTASMLVIQGSTGMGAAELIIDEQSGLVLSFELSGGITELPQFDGDQIRACAMEYLAYIGVEGSVRSLRDTLAEFSLTASGVKYWVIFDGRKAAIYPFGK